MSRICENLRRLRTIVSSSPGSYLRLFSAKASATGRHAAPIWPFGSLSLVPYDLNEKLVERVAHISLPVGTAFSESASLISDAPRVSIIHYVEFLLRSLPSLTGPFSRYSVLQGFSNSSRCGEAAGHDDLHIATYPGR